MERRLASMRYEVASRDAITPFVCSTFKDFSKERNYLADVVFPQLQERCKERATRFSPVDLRWIEGSCNTNDTRVLQQCFDAIKECSPFFICLLGERYGVHRPPDSASHSDETMSATITWLDRNFEMAAACGNDWVMDKENKHCSLTELEIIKASFRERTDHGYFYFRDPDHLDEQSVDLNTSQKAMLMEIYESESEFAARRVRELKQQIIDTDLPMRHFKTVEELGQLVLKDWVLVLDSLYPPIEKKIFASVHDGDFREWSAHESFAKTRRKVFVETDFIRMTLDTLTRHAQYLSPGPDGRKSSSSLTKINEGTFLTSVLGVETFPSIVALVGERGGGASAILSNWVKKFIRDHPGTVVLSHYAESGQRSAEITSFMRRCTSELRSEYRGLNPIVQLDFLNLSDFDTITEAFHASLSLGPCVLVLDGLYHLTACQDIAAHVIKQLSWLPINIPPECRVVVSTTRSDISYKYLSSRSDVQLIDIPALNNSEKSRVLREWRGLHARHLDPRDEATILAGKLSGRPVYHAVLANEIRLHGRAEVGERLLEACTHARCLSDFWTAVIHTWAQDYSWLKPNIVKNGVSVKTQISKDRFNNGWIPDTLRFLAVSREGLTSDELRKILNAVGYSNKHAISSAAWALFTSAAKRAIYERNNGLLTFQQASLREAVDALLLNSLTSPSHVRHVTTFENPWELQKFQFHSMLSKGFSQFSCNVRLVNELPWQLRAAADVSGLKATLMRPDVFVKMWSNIKDLSFVVDFLNYWKFLTQEKCGVVDSYCSMLEEIARPLEETGNNTSAQRTSDSGDLTHAENHGIANRILSKKHGSKYTPIEVAYVAYLIGICFLGLQEFESAETTLQRALKLSRDVTSIDDVDFLCQVYKSLGDLYFDWRKLDKAVGYYEAVLKTAVEVSRYVNMDEGMLVAIQAHSKHRLASISIRLGLNSRGFSNFFTRNDKISGKKKGNSLALVPQTEDQLNEASRLMEIAKFEEEKGALCHAMGLLAICEKRLDDAEQLLNRAIDAMERWYGRSHPAVATVLQDLARYYCCCDQEEQDITKIEKLYRRVLHIREKKLGKSHLDVAETLLELGCVLKKKGTRDSLQECRNLLQRSVDIRTEKLGMYHECSIEVRRMLVQLG